MFGVNFEVDYIKRIYNQPMRYKGLFFNIGSTFADEKHLVGIEFSPIISFISCSNNNYAISHGTKFPIFAYYYYRITNNFNYLNFYIGAKAGYGGSYVFEIDYTDENDTIWVLDGLQHTERIYGGPILKALLGFKLVQLNMACGLLICSRTTENSESKSTKKYTHVYPSFHTEIGANFIIGKHTISEKTKKKWNENGKFMLSYDLLLLTIKNSFALSSNLNFGIKYKRNYWGLNGMIPFLFKYRLGGLGFTYKYEYIINDIFLLSPGVNFYIYQYYDFNSNHGNSCYPILFEEGYFFGPQVELGIGRKSIFFKLKSILLCGAQGVKLSPSLGISFYF